MKNYYKILEVDKSASQAQIKKAYRILAKKYHPDKSNSVHSARLFSEINEAYEILSDPHKRAQFDQRNLSGSYQTDYRSPSATNRGSHQPQYRRRPAYRPTKKETLDLRPYVPYFRSISIAGLALSLFLCLDFLIPRKVAHERILKIENVIMRSKSGGGSVIAKKIVTANGAYQIGEVLPTGMSKNQFIQINKTRILSITTMVDYSTDQEHSEYAVAASIYGNFSFSWILLLIISTIGIVLKKSPEMIVNFGIVNAILILLVLGFITAS